MKIQRLSGLPDTATLATAAACVEGGGTLIFPTDTVYGIGCAPEDERAIEAIFAAKGRPQDKPLAVHLAHPEDAGAYAERLTRAARAIIDRFWPGPVAIVVERKANRYACAARYGSTLALRCPDHEVCRMILDATGPLAATSANASGMPPYTGVQEDVRALPEANLAIIAGPTKERRESTVLDCSGDVVRVVRAGALGAAEIEAALAGIAALEHR